MRVERDLPEGRRDALSKDRSRRGRVVLGLDSVHPAITRNSSDPFAAGRYDDAIFNAFKTVEAELRRRSASGHDDIGVELVSKALQPRSGRLRLSDIEAEQQAAHLLYRGAIGLFKNPLSHRFVGETDRVRAFELLCFASLLLRLLEAATPTYVDSVLELVFQGERLAAVKTAREGGGLNLKEAKDLVDSLWRDVYGDTGAKRL